MSLPIPFKQTNVLKAVIVPYKNKDTRVPKIQDIFVIPVNPETYNESLKVENDGRVAAGNQHTVIRYLTTPSQELKIEFILDGTNTIQGYFNVGNLPVLAQIARLKRAVYDLQSSSHKPNYVKVFWGSLVFSGSLSTMDLNYILFNPIGIPLRVKVNLMLTQHVSEEEGCAIARKNSPDVTHLKDFKAGQRLDQLATEIYNDPQYVLQVAKANQLTSFRKVKVGTKLTFPPVDNRTT